MIKKLTSRKLWAFAVATVLMVTGDVSEHSWLIVAAAYMGGQGIADAARYFRSGDA